jgi:hypothetical protein
VIHLQPCALQVPTKSTIILNVPIKVLRLNGELSPRNKELMVGMINEQAAASDLRTIKTVRLLSHEK